MISIDPAYNGPTGFGHGGVSAGRFAELVNPTAASVRFAAPIPLATELLPTAAGGGAVKVSSGDRLIATVSPLSDPLDVAPFSPVDADEVAAAEARSVFRVGQDHPYPLCFGCGNAREHHDGLELFAGPLTDRSHAVDGGEFAVRWTPPGTDDVAPWLVWGALDCPTAAPAFAAVSEGSAALTGTLAVEQYDRIVGGVEYQIHSRLVDVDGRKLRTEGALVAPDGANPAVVAATWVAVPADLKLTA